MSANFYEIQQALISLAAAIVAAGIPVLVAYIHVRFKTANDADIARTLQATADAAAHLADVWARSHTNSPPTGPIPPAIGAQAVQIGTMHLMATQRMALAHFGMDQEAARNMVVARMDVAVLPRPS